MVARKRDLKQVDAVARTLGIKGVKARRQLGEHIEKYKRWLGKSGEDLTREELLEAGTDFKERRGYNE